MKITEKMVEAGLKAEWMTFHPRNIWPDGCPPSARERWREAFTAGLRAAIRSSHRKSSGRKEGKK